MTDHTPDFHEVRGAYISWLPAMFTEKRVAEFDRFINKVKADALREAGAAVMGERLETETEAGNWLDERADRIEGEA